MECEALWAWRAAMLALMAAAWLLRGFLPWPSPQDETDEEWLERQERGI